MKAITMNPELLVELLGKRGFILDENNDLKYASGSISNYTTLRICQPRPYCSLAENEKYVPACFVQYETFSEPGYLECDWKHTSEGYVQERFLLKWLDEKGIRNRDEVKREREERRRELKARIEAKKALVRAMYENAVDED